MTADGLVNTARALVGDGRGLLAMDESVPTCNRRFASAGISQTEATRRRYRELLITTPHLAGCISGVILHDETIRQAKLDGTSFLQFLAGAGIVPGIKVDTGAKQLALHQGETITEGLDGLRARLEAYFSMGARFAKWRAVIAVGPGLPTACAISANAHALGRYAALCQEAGLVPIIEPEVLMTGSHTIERCGEITREVLSSVFGQMHRQGVGLDGLVLKVNMVLPGLDSPPAGQVAAPEVADATLACLLEVVPPAVAGIVFLSGGQSSEVASLRLNAINAQSRVPKTRIPWALSFSFARAIQQPALGIWHGEEANAAHAQQVLFHRAACNWAALRGDYDTSMEQRRYGAEQGHDDSIPPFDLDAFMVGHRSLQAAQ